MCSIFYKQKVNCLWLIHANDHKRQLRKLYKVNSAKVSGVPLGPWAVAGCLRRSRCDINRCQQGEYRSTCLWKMEWQSCAKMLNNNNNYPPFQRKFMWKSLQHVAVHCSQIQKWVHEDIHKPFSRVYPFCHSEVGAASVVHFIHSKFFRRGLLKAFLKVIFCMILNICRSKSSTAMLQLTWIVSI